MDLPCFHGIERDADPTIYRWRQRGIVLIPIGRLPEVTRVLITRRTVNLRPWIQGHDAGTRMTTLYLVEELRPGPWFLSLPLFNGDGCSPALGRKVMNAPRRLTGLRVVRMEYVSVGVLGAPSVNPLMRERELHPTSLIHPFGGSSGT